MAVWGPDAAPRDVPEPLPDAPLRPAERWWDLILVPVVALAFSFAAGAMAVVIEVAIGERGLLTGSFTSGNVEQSPYFLFGAMGALYLAMLGAVALLLFWRGHRFGPVFFARGRRFAAWAAIPAGIVLAIAVMVLLSMLPAAMQEELIEQNSALDPSTLGEALAVFVVAVLFAPLAEELYFRGIMLRVFSRGMSFAAASVVTAALFSLVHGHLFLSPGLGGWLLTGIIFLLGFLLALFARAGRSLRAPFLLHASYNATLVVPTIAGFLSGAQT
jgi:membrane protease YdiL (CAAX protease family)